MLKIDKHQMLAPNKTGTSQVGAMSKAQIKSKGKPFGFKKIREKVAQCQQNRKGGPFTLIRFCRLRLKNKRPLDKEVSEKKLQSAEKNRIGGTL